MLRGICDILLGQPGDLPIGRLDAFITHQLDNCFDNSYDYYGYRESGFDSGEGAWEIATSAMTCSRRENYPMIIFYRGSDKK